VYAKPDPWFTFVDLMRVAFLGLGNMGVGMAARLIAAGHPLSVYNRTTARAAALQTLGARVVHSAREAAHGAGVVVAMTANDESSRATWLGPEGALAAMDGPDALASNVRPCRTTGCWSWPTTRDRAAFATSTRP
jgi:3-hydroxyacyl-CoA dehydrogenase